jgi:heat shock protein HslJ
VNTRRHHTKYRHRHAWLILTTAALLLIAACGDSGGEPLDGTTWTPTDLGAISVVAGSDVFVSFGADAQLNGATGCNAFTGGWSTDGGDGGIEIITGGMTLAVCATEDLQAQETAFLGALNAALFYERDDGSLTLLDGNKNQLAELTEAGVDQ